MRSQRRSRIRSAGEQCDNKWMVNRLLGERRAERRVSEQQKGVSGEGGEEREGRRAGLWLGTTVE